jgi:hypothetical protein
MECRRDLDVVGTALPKETERHASPVCVGAGVRNKVKSHPRYLLPSTEDLWL